MSTAQTMKIYSIISSIEQELEESPRTKFGGQSRRVVEIERLYDLLGDLKVTIPEDIRRATGVLAEADNRINDAKEQAEEILAQAHEEADSVLSQAQASAENLYHQAQVEYETRISDAEVYKEACARAAQISSEAETNANAIYNGARKYADDILSDVQRYLSEYHAMIAQNRNELGVPAPAAPEPPRAYQQPAYAPAQQSAYAPEAQPAYQQPAQQPAYQQQQSAHAVDDGMTRQFERPAAPQRTRARELEREDEEYEAPRREKPKKKGFLSKMFEIDDEDEEFDEEWEQDDAHRREKPKKQRKKLFDFSDDEDDDEY